MNTFDFEIDNVRITIVGNSGEEVAQVLRDNDLAPLLHNNFYFSKTTQQRTGDGWIRLQDMNENFIVNSYAARLSETIRDIHKTVRASGSEIAESLFLGFLQDLTNVLEYNSVLADPNDNLPILNGLVNELERRSIQETLNSGFDAEPDDVVSSDSCTPDCSCNDGVAEPAFISLSGGSNLRFLDQA